MEPPGVVIYNSSKLKRQQIKIRYFFVLYLVDDYVALERSTAQSTSIHIKKFLEQYPNYTSTYKSWQKLEAHILVKTK